MARKVVECRTCGQLKEQHAHGLCHVCYKKESNKHRKKITCVTCGKTKIHDSHGMCKNCANRRREKEKCIFKIKKERTLKPDVICSRCNNLRKHHARGFCKNCYKTVREKEKRAILKKNKVPSLDVDKPYCGKISECKECKVYGAIHAHDLCARCYHKVGMRLIECSKCKQTKRIHSNNMCETCYQSTYSKNEVCVICKQYKKIHAYGMCNTCYQQERREMGAVPAKKVVYAECVSCNQHKKIRSLGKCHDCYVRDRNANLEPIECELCGETRTKYIGNLCKSCYTFRRQQKRVYHPGMCDFCLTVAVAPLKVVDGKHACVKCLRKYYPQHYEVILENARRRSRIKSADNVNIEWLIRELSKV